MTRAENPTSGASLLEKSKAKPVSVDMSIFEKKGSRSGGAGGSSSVGQGTTSSDYLQRTREDNPAPPAESPTESVTLSNCKITTPPEKLAPEQPFEMSVDAKAAAGEPSGKVVFKLFCTMTKSDGTEECQDQSAPVEAQIKNGIATATGTLVSPKSPVPAGTKLKYHVAAEHPLAKEKADSAKAEVAADTPPQPLAVWSLGAVHFGFDSSFVLPTAAEKLAEFKKTISAHAGAAVAVFGHADPIGDDDYNKKLSGRRAYSVFCLLSHDIDGWAELSNGTDGDKWDLRATQTMLSHLKAKSGALYYGSAIDGKTGPKTEAATKEFQKDNGLKVDGIAGPVTSKKLHETYMKALCDTPVPKTDFVGDPQDNKRQWACVGCGEFNPVLVFSKADDDKFRSASDKGERNAKNAPNRRATVMLFPASAKGPGKITFPCPAWGDGASKCKAQLFEDADKRRNPSDAERTWEKDKDTFACKFYAGIGNKESSSGASGEFQSYRISPNVDQDFDFAFYAGSLKVEGSKKANAPIQLELPTSIDSGRLEVTTKAPVFKYEWDIQLKPFEAIGNTKGIQQRLVNLGYYDRTPDGSESPEYHQALVDFQVDNEIEATGQVDTETRTVLSRYFPGSN
jgi:outer membrane protein OmpA-like peptidoglycan-associated protein